MSQQNRQLHKAFEVRGLTTGSFYPSSPVIRHQHNEIELNLSANGSLTYLFGGNYVSLAPNQVGVFWAAIPHNLIHMDSTTVLYWLTIPLAWFLDWGLPQQFTKQILNGRFIVERSNTYIHSDHVWFTQWRNDLETNPHENRRMILLEIEARLHRLWQAHESLPTSENKFMLANGGLHTAERIACFIADHYNNSELRVREIAEAVGLHPSYATRLFRQSFGMPIVAYLTEYRVATAQRLLVTTDQQIIDIAFEVGFGSISRFYAVFKQICGISPREYRMSLAIHPKHRQHEYKLGRA